MACYFERKNAIRKDPLALVSFTLGLGLEVCFVVALGFFIMTASPEPAPSYTHAKQAAQDFIIPADDQGHEG